MHQTVTANGLKMKRSHCDIPRNERAEDLAKTNRASSDMVFALTELVLVFSGFQCVHSAHQKAYGL
jgi:hypothetical protein